MLNITGFQWTEWWDSARLFSFDDLLKVDWVMNVLLITYFTHKKKTNHKHFFQYELDHSCTQSLGSLYNKARDYFIKEWNIKASLNSMWNGVRLSIA